MKTKIFKNANYIGWIVIILTFIFIYFSYFFIYIPKKEANLQQKGFRILREYGSNMLDKYQYFENHFKNYGIFYSIQFLEKSGKISKKKLNEANTENRGKIENVIKGLQAFVETNYSVKDTSSNLEGKKESLSFNSQSTNGGLIDSIKKYYNANGSENINSLLLKSFTYNVPYNSFMNNLKFDELFENIILFNETKIIFNSDNRNLADITNPKALSDSTKKSQGGIYKTLIIRGENKHLIIVPVDLAGRKFFISGSISDIDYINKTRTINKQLLIFIAGILFLIIAGMPILKIIFIDDRERLKSGDASSSGISLIFGISIFILIVLAFSKKYIVDRVSQENRIEKISDKLYSNVLNDIDSLKILGSAIANKRNKQYVSLQNNVLDKFNSDTRFYQDSNLNGPFPLNEIILINSNGIFSKGYTSTPFSDIVKVDLSERQYFKNIKDIDKSWPTADSLNLNLYIESIKSLNTGAVETAISFYTENFDSLKVLALTSKIPSLYLQVLPKDIEFVIINNNGKVLFHSIEDKNLHENFVLECESDLQLINAINSRNAAIFQINYNEKTWLARIVPVKDTPLFHITLLDLNQADNKNTRIFLFTFYFLIATLIFIVTGLLVMRWISLSQKQIKKNYWFLSWIVFRPGKFLLYNKLSVILLAIIVVQLIGLFIKVSPVTILLYQFILIVYSLFVSMAFLNRSESKTKKSFHNEYFIELNILLAIILLVLFFLWKSEISVKFIFQFLFLIILTIYITWFLINYNPKNEKYNPLKHHNELRAKRSFLIFLFLWISSISAVPVIVYYFSIKNLEEEKWKTEQLYKVARANVDLQTEFGNPDKDWYKRIQGNDIDNMKVLYFPSSKKFYNSTRKDSVDGTYDYKIYSTLPDPVTSWYNQPKLKNQNFYVNYKFYNDSLLYKKGLKTGTILVNYSKHERFYPVLNYVFLICCIFVLIGLCGWFLLKFLARVLLNLNQEKPAGNQISWELILKNKDFKRILLNTYDEACFLEKSFKLAKLKYSGIKEIKRITVSEIITRDFKAELLATNPEILVWISGFNQLIYDLDKHDDLLSVFNELDKFLPCRIIVDLPFDIGLLNEFYDDYIASAEIKPEQLTHIFQLRKKWKNLFNQYYHFNGYINQNRTDEIDNITDEDKYKTECLGLDTDFRFSNIWNNLTLLEKIVLFDLADDGLLNRKNKDIIQNLINKRLIVPDPVPAFFSEEFLDFVTKNFRLAEVKSIERKLGLKGNWHNAKYLIILILIPLAAFIVISQGFSIEKVFGIFAGGLAIITGILRLLDSSSFRQ